jgi:hypothetical protein
LKGRLSWDFNYASTTQLCPRKRPFSISNYDSFPTVVRYAG